MPRESRDRKIDRAQKIVALLERYYPNAHCALNYSSPEQLLVATVLSAQCTDERVNQVTRVLFAKHPDLKSLSQLSQEELEGLIRPTGFFRNKAKSLLALSRELMAENGGKVPPIMERLVRLPGVGRKTANVVLGNAFHITSGIVVDTHVSRLSGRLGLTRGRTAEAIENDLVELIPKSKWILFSHWLIEHGRRVCKARKPDCERCFLVDLCPKKLSDNK